MSRTGQLAIAGKLTAGSPLGAMISSHVAGALDEPLIVLLEQDRADDDGVLGGRCRSPRFAAFTPANVIVRWSGLARAFPGVVLNEENSTLVNP